MTLPLRASHQPSSTSSISLPSNSSSEPFQFKATTTAAAATHLPFKKSRLSWSRLQHDSSAQCDLPKLSRGWMQYQGVNNWDGMLDPLDDTLRHEILRYGQFVDAAYRSFDYDMSSPTYAMSRFPKRSLLSRSGIQKYGYRITRNLRATCGIRLPKWIDKVPWKFNLCSWIGYVAVCNDKEEIARLGRRDVVISLRGTSTCLEWLENARAALTSLPEDMGGKGGEAMVEKGFLSLYVSKTPKTPSLREMVREEVKKIIHSYGDEPLSLTVTGHSLGAALAILSAYDIATTFKKKAPMVTVVSFGGPRVGNESFRRQLEQSGTKILRIVNSDDVITKVPGFVARSDDVAGDGVAHIGSLPAWLHRRVEDLQWVYADVGQELRLSSRESPYLKSLDLATCHDLKTYLRLVNDFVSSTCTCTTKTKQYPSEAWM